jgi:hypothetical protein
VRLGYASPIRYDLEDAAFATVEQRWAAWWDARPR